MNKHRNGANVMIHKERLDQHQLKQPEKAQERIFQKKITF